MKAFSTRHSILIGLVLLLPAAAAAQLSPDQYSYPRHHLPWFTIASEHFSVHFQEGNHRSAREAARIAEKVFPGITGLYGYVPGEKVNIVLRDREDDSNGAAYFFDNQIDIWVPALNSPLRGTHDWLENVITHEFTHIVQLGASMKRTRRIPAIYLQWLSYEEVRRPDVLYGYPNALVTHPFAGVSMPAWMAEGFAQYQRSGWTYDTWDSHRDMVLRSAILHENWLGFTEMGIFSSKNSLQREQVYNQGFGFTIWLVQQYGESVLADLTAEFSRPGVFSAGEALENVTGTPGQELFDRWIASRRQFYRQALEGVRTSDHSIVRDEGFFNFSPRYAPGGQHIAYLSNRGRDEARTSLYIFDRESGEPVATLDLGPARNERRYGAAPLIKAIEQSFDFSPGGRRIVFTRNILTPAGEAYNDLFIYNLENKKEQRLTRGERIWDPAWSPDGSRLAAVRQNRGTLNLVLLNTDGSGIEALTGYRDGQQVYTPDWHPSGDRIYFAWSEGQPRDIMKFDLGTRTVTPVLEDPWITYRDPHIDHEGLFLYYSSDPDGIFNIYRAPVGARGEEKITSVEGGAFMPEVYGHDELIFSLYGENGYAIAMLDDPGSGREYGFYEPPVEHGARFLADSSAALQPDPEENEISLSEIREYEDTFTGISFYPVIRFDNYSKLNGGNAQLVKAGNFGGLAENLARDLKLGTYISSREVTGRLRIFGGALFGVGSLPAGGIGDFFQPSRLTDLDRDLFLVTEYEGLPFIKKHWSPTVSLELYNLRRNVRDGLAIEEFPCTACLPDTLHADLAYNIWEADLYLRSKLNDSNLLELGIAYSPYRVETEGFFSRELQQAIPASSSEYFKSTTLSAAWVYEEFKPYRHSDTAPLGLRTHVKYAWQSARLLEDYEISDGLLRPVYEPSRNHSVELSAQYGFSLGKSHSVSLYSRFFSYLNHPRDHFYQDYIGGFTGMRSYPYFALGGATTAFGQVSLTLPLLTGIHRQAGPYTADKLFARLFAETGNGWRSPMDIGSSLKTGVGTELRFAFNSYYLFPMKLFISGAWGFNRFDVNLPDEFITGNSSGRVSYGRELMLHVGLTFDFNTLNRE